MFVEGNKRINIAISNDRSVRFNTFNMFGEYCFEVVKENTEIFGLFGFDPHDHVGQREAYAKAADLYNKLVSDEEAIPLF